MRILLDKHIPSLTPAEGYRDSPHIFMHKGEEAKREGEKLFWDTVIFLGAYKWLQAPAICNLQMFGGKPGRNQFCYFIPWGSREHAGLLNKNPWRFSTELLCWHWQAIDLNKSDQASSDSRVCTAWQPSLFLLLSSSSLLPKMGLQCYSLQVSLSEAQHLLTTSFLT